MGDYMDGARVPKAVATPKARTQQERELREIKRNHSCRSVPRACQAQGPCELPQVALAVDQ
eukprot:10346949-Lingulodinium_polyedra.AAC.1